MNQNNSEILQGIISVTRDQLSKSMSLNAELEVMLALERRKNDDLSQQLEALTKNSSEKK